MNLVEVLAVGGIFHPGLSPQERCENALTSFLLLELGKMISDESCKELGLRKSSRWIAPQTHKNLCELCALICIQVMGLPGNMPHLPWRSSELPLEQHFGFLRRQYTTAQLRTRDYIQSLAKQMWATSKKMKDSKHLDVAGATFPQALSEDEFCTCASKALASSIKLMAACCKPLASSGLKAWVLTCHLRFWIFWA